MKNENGYIACDESSMKNRKEEMDRFDSYPPEIRAILRDAPYSLGIKASELKRFPKGRFLKETIQRIARESALKTYGKNYPLDTV